MDAQQIRGLRPMLARFLKRFDDCFARKDTRRHRSVYVNGQLSDLERKSVEPIALAADVPDERCRSLSASIAGKKLRHAIACSRSSPRNMPIRIPSASLMKPVL